MHSRHTITQQIHQFRCPSQSAMEQEMEQKFCSYGEPGSKYPMSIAINISNCSFIPANLIGLSENLKNWMASLNARSTQMMKSFSKQRNCQLFRYQMWGWPSYLDELLKDKARRRTINDLNSKHYRRIASINPFMSVFSHYFWSTIRCYWIRLRKQLTATTR